MPPTRLYGPTSIHHIDGAPYLDAGVILAGFGSIDVRQCSSLTVLAMLEVLKDAVRAELTESYASTLSVAVERRSASTTTR